MRPIVLQTLTWGTVVAAVSSALWLAWADNRAEAARNHLSARRVTTTLPAVKSGARPVVVGALPVATGTRVIAGLPTVAVNAVGAGFQRAAVIGFVTTSAEGR